jgi:hypothetical protein
MGDQVVVLVDALGNIQKVLMCRDKSHESIVSEVQTRWQSLFTTQHKLVIANVVSVDICTAIFSPGGWLDIPTGTVRTKE